MNSCQILVGLILQLRRFFFQMYTKNNNPLRGSAAAGEGGGLISRPV